MNLSHLGTPPWIRYACLWLLQQLKEPDVNLRAVFSFNDFNFSGIILVAGLLVLCIRSNMLDLLGELATAVIAIKVGPEILRDARYATKKDAAKRS